MKSHNIILGAQYYRPPTPTSENWVRDIKRMKEAGLNTVQLWAVWGWIEPKEGKFVFDDYDRLVELADKNKMKVVISTITDLQPFWVPRLYPHTVMLDEFGQPIKGTPRQECLCGLTPGHCTDHREIRDLSVRFMRELASHYKQAPLAGWDCWNETRWSVCCDRWVCYCPATIKAFRAFLLKRYGNIKKLSEAWGCRLTSWEDVFPARSRSFLNPALLDWARFHIYRAYEMGIWRRDAIREGDPTHIIAAHCGSPVNHSQKWSEEIPFSRGNDFDIAPELDAFGTSAFPAWFGFDNTALGIWMEVTRSAAHPKPVWESEMQGGAFNQGFNYGIPVSGDLQQYWTWQSISRGAKAVIYWSWRDETWGVEAGGYGIDGQDGKAEDRIRAMRKTRRLLDEHASELSSYIPDPATVGVVHDTNSALIPTMNREKNSAAVTNGINGCLTALERQRIPFDLLDGRRLTIHKHIKLLLIPSSLCLNASAEETILRFLKRGGWVYCEAGTGSFLENGFFVDRPGKRALLGKLGIRSLYRRGNHADASCRVPAETWPESPEFSLSGALWSVALDAPKPARIISRDILGDAVLVETKFGKGRLIVSGSFPANAYCDKPYEGFEKLIFSLTKASGAMPRWRVVGNPDLNGLAVRTGRSGKKRLFFLLNAGEAREVTVFPARKPRSTIREWTSGKTLVSKADGSFTLTLSNPSHKIVEWNT